MKRKLIPKAVLKRALESAMNVYCKGVEHDTVKFGNHWKWVELTPMQQRHQLEGLEAAIHVVLDYLERKQ